MVGGAYSLSESELNHRMLFLEEKKACCNSQQAFFIFRDIRDIKDIRI